MKGQHSENMKIAQRVTLVGMLLDLILGILKILIGITSYSHALIADGIHSLSDVVTDIFVLIITRISHHEPDIDHPYGHARFEALGTVLLGGILVLVGVLLAYENLSRVTNAADTRIPEWPVLVVAAISVVSKEWVFHYTRKAGEKLRSNLLIANAWHSRTDAFSSIIVLVGVGGAMLGFVWLDAVAAIVVAIILCKIGSSLLWDALKELVDTGLNPEETSAMKEAVMSIEGVRGVHDLRTRKMGESTFLDLHIRVNPTVSVSEGHQIGEWVTQKLLREFDSIIDLTYHIDVENDAMTPLDLHTPLLPLRPEVLKVLKDCWKDVPEIDKLNDCALHYLDNKIDIELFFTKPISAQDAGALLQLKERLARQSEEIEWRGNLTLWFGQ